MPKANYEARFRDGFFVIASRWQDGRNAKFLFPLIYQYINLIVKHSDTQNKTHAISIQYESENSKVKFQSMT